MATISTKCPNCGGTMKLKDSLLQCPYCETIFLHIADARIESEVAVISPAKFAKKIEASKRQFVIKINDKLQVFDIDTKVINKRIQDAKGFLESGEFDKVPGALTGVPVDILAAERLRFLCDFGARNESELLGFNVTVEDNIHYRRILELADAQTKETYLRLGEFCREKYEAREAAISKVKEGEKLLEVNLNDDALIYANQMVQKYPAYAITWLFLAHVKRRIKPNYRCEREWGILHHCFDFSYYNGHFPYGLNEVFQRYFGHNVKLSDRMGKAYDKWAEILGISCTAMCGGSLGIMLIFLWVPLWLVVGALIAPGVWLYHLPRMLRGKRAIERAAPDATDQQ